MNHRRAGHSRSGPLPGMQTYSIIELNTGYDIAFSPRQAEGLQTAKPHQLDPIELTPSGFGLHFPKFEADLYLPSLLQGNLAPSSGPLLSWVREGAGQQARRRQRLQEETVSFAAGPKRRN
jgi:hypothetical protein